MSLPKVTVFRPVAMHGSETWALRNTKQNLLERTEMRMLIWMMGVKRIEKIRNENIRSRAGVAKSEKIRGARLERVKFGRVEIKTEDVVMRTWKRVDTET